MNPVSRALVLLALSLFLVSGFPQDPDPAYTPSTAADEDPDTDLDAPEEDATEPEEPETRVESPDRFVPSEEISEDNSVPFPVDI